MLFLCLCYATDTDIICINVFFPRTNLLTSQAALSCSYLDPNTESYILDNVIKNHQLVPGPNFAYGIHFILIKPLKIRAFIPFYK